MVLFASSKCEETLNDSFYLIEMEGYGLHRHMPKRELLKVRVWITLKSHFQSVGQEECLSLIWKHTEDVSGENDYSKQNFICCFPNLFDDLDETVGYLGKDELNTTQFFNFICRLWQNLMTKKNTFFLK